MSLFLRFFIGNTLCLIQESIGMFLLRTYCVFEGYLVHNQATKRVLVEMLCLKAVLVLMTNKNIFSQSALL